MFIMSWYAQDSVSTLETRRDEWDRGDMGPIRERLGSAILLLTMPLLLMACGAQQAESPSALEGTPTLTPIAGAGGMVTLTRAASTRLGGTPTPDAGGVPIAADAPRLLQLTWQGYTRDEIQADGRVIDHQRTGVSTSEGQSYALLRAVWMDDRPTFARVWAWTHDNLQVRSDRLFGYLWGRRPDGRWTILSTDSATDADEDIALAMLFAAHRWHESGYLAEAQAIAQDIWRREVVTVQGVPYLTAGNWAPSYTTPGPALDPSYFAPYAYRLFARIDPARPWSRLVASSYDALNACSTMLLSAGRSVGLPPNWCALRAGTRTVVAIPRFATADDYGYDAFRAMWRAALDAIWNGDPRAKAYLNHSSFLRTQWRERGALTSYTHAGKAAGPEIPLFYGGDIGAFVVSDPAAAKVILLDKLLPLFHQSDGVAYWDQRYNYYEQNWVWFGVALASSRLPNLASP